MQNPNARIKFTDSQGNPFQRLLWIDRFSQGNAVAGEIHQSLAFSHFYGKNNQPGPLKVEGRVPNQEHYDALATFIRHYHKAVIDERGSSNILNKGGLSLIQLYIPSEGFVVEGLIEGFVAGKKRFNPAPPFTFDFRVIKDHGSKSNDLFASYPQRSIWTINLAATEIDKTRISDILQPFELLDSLQSFDDTDPTAKFRPF